MKFHSIKKYIKSSFQGKPSFLIELDNDGVIREYISNGCTFIENTAENIEAIVKKYNCRSFIDELLNSDVIDNYKCITDARHMFRGSEEITELTLSLPNAEYCDYMLRGCRRLTKLTLSLPNAKYCEYTLNDCSRLIKLTLSIPKAKFCWYMLNDCSSLTKENTRISHIGL